MIKKVEKKWGYEEWLVNTELYCAKYLVLVKGNQCSLHFHREKDETFYVVQGRVMIEIENDLGGYDFTVLGVGTQVRIKPTIKHRFRAVTNEATILEVSTHHSDEDSYRIEESCKDNG